VIAAIAERSGEAVRKALRAGADDVFFYLRNLATFPAVWSVSARPTGAPARTMR
jgi:hypothetical protein